MEAMGSWGANQPYVLIVAGGDAPSSDRVSQVVKPAVVVAADSGADVANALGYEVDVLVGDQDSVSDEGLARSHAIEVSPADKDQTDLELALDRACRFETERIVVIGAGGGREDHFLANIAAMSRPRNRRIESITEVGHTWFVHDAWQAGSAAGQTLSILPVGGPARGVSTSGLRWELTAAELQPDEAVGISNVADQQEISIRVATGVLAVIAPSRP